MNDTGAKAIEASLLGTRIKEMREAKNVTISQLASDAEISRTYLWQLENNRSRPGIDVLARLAGALGVGYAELMPEIPDSDRHTRSVTDRVLRSWLAVRASAAQRAFVYAELSYPLEKFEEVVVHIDRVGQGLHNGDPYVEFLLGGARFDRQGDVEGAIDALREARSAIRDPDIVPVIDWNMAILYSKAYRYDLALDRLAQAHGQLSDTVEDEFADVVGMLTTLGWLGYRVGHYQQAVRYFEQAIATRKKAQAPGPLAAEESALAATRGLGSSYQRLGRFEDAEAKLQETWRRASTEKDQIELAWVTARLGFLFIHSGEWARAHEHLDQAMQMSNELLKTRPTNRGLRVLQEIILNNTGLLYLREGESDEALDKSRESLKCAEELEPQDLRGMAFCHLFLGLIHADRGEWKEAEQHVWDADLRFRHMGIRYFLVEVMALQASVLCATGRAQAGLIPSQEAVHIATAPLTASPYQEALARMSLGSVYAELSEFDAAEQQLRMSVGLLEEIGEEYELAKTRLEYGRVVARMGRTPEALQCLGLALDTADEMGASPIAQMAKEALGNLEAMGP